MNTGAYISLHFVIISTGLAPGCHIDWVRTQLSYRLSEANGNISRRCPDSRWSLDMTSKLRFRHALHDMKHALWINGKSRLVNLVLLPLWYGNKDIIRDNISKCHRRELWHRINRYSSISSEITWRLVTPVRVLIHSSLVSRNCDSMSLVTICFGSALPVPVILMFSNFWSAHMFAL